MRCESCGLGAGGNPDLTNTSHMTIRPVEAGRVEEDATSVATRTKKRRGRPGYDLPTLIESSVEVFHTMGFDGTSMEDLSKHLGISKSAIYHHVASNLSGFT